MEDNNVAFGEKPKEIWNSESGKPLPTTNNNNIGRKNERIPEADRMQRQGDSLTIEGINRLLSRLSLMNIRKSLTASYILLAMTQQKKQENESQKKPKGWQKFKRSLDGNLHVIQEEE